MPVLVAVLLGSITSTIMEAGHRLGTGRCLKTVDHSENLCRIDANSGRIVEDQPELLLRVDDENGT